MVRRQFALAIDINLKRIYDEPSKSDGLRILVDRLWPRGVSKDAAQIDIWAKDMAPSDDLRKWFGHDRSKWEPFKARYFSELDSKGQIVRDLVSEIRGRQVTFVFAAKDAEFSNATALVEYLKRLE